jgi:hypothetical protein
VGSSGGACAGSFLFLDVDTDRVIDYICECAVTAHSSWRAALRIHDYVKGACRRFMTPDAGAPISLLHGLYMRPGACACAPGACALMHAPCTSLTACNGYMRRKRKRAPGEHAGRQGMACGSCVGISCT